MRYFRGQKFNRTVTAAPAVAMFCVSLALTGPASAQDAERPLGRDAARAGAAERELRALVTARERDDVGGEGGERHRVEEDGRLELEERRFEVA